MRRESRIEQLERENEELRGAVAIWQKLADERKEQIAAQSERLSSLQSENTRTPAQIGQAIADKLRASQQEPTEDMRRAAATVAATTGLQSAERVADPEAYELIRLALDDLKQFRIADQGYIGEPSMHERMEAYLRRTPSSEGATTEGFYEKMWKDFASLQRGDAVGIVEKVERYYREQEGRASSATKRTPQKGDPAGKCGLCGGDLVWYIDHRCMGTISDSESRPK